MKAETERGAFKNLDSEEFSEDEKMDAIVGVASMEKHTSVTKNELLAALRWVIDNFYEGA